MTIVIPKTRIIVCLEGGVVQNVYCSDPEAKMALLDIDEETTNGLPDSVFPSPEGRRNSRENTKASNDRLRNEIKDLHEVF